MRRVIPARFSLRSAVGGCTATILALANAASPIFAQALPPAAPTHPSAASPGTAPANPAAPPSGQAVVLHASYRAHVELTDGILAVSAENSSLNQILNEIARLTGMKITGGVTDERVYGNYGPAGAPEVLAQLLVGTGTNVLVLQNSQHGVQELVLSPRQGGPSPPSPSASHAGERDDADLPQQPALGQQPTPGRRRALDEARERENQARRQIDLPGATVQPAPPSTESGAGTPDTAGKTPQQIYEDLVKQQQQQQQTQPPPANPPQ